MSIVAPDKTTAFEYALELRSSGGPDWLWNLAGENIHRRPDQFLRELGPSFLDVLHFRTLCAHSPVGVKQALAIYPAIAAAEQLNSDLEKTKHLKVAVLGEIDLKEISQRFGIDEAVLGTWEKVFYDIRGTRSAWAWIQVYVIQPELASGRADLAARLRMVSAVGTIAAQVILKADTRLPINEAQKLFERQLKLHLKFDAAVNMTSDTNKNRLFFIRQHVRLMQGQKRLEFAREMLEKKCEEALDRHKLAMIRAEIVLERERNRAAVIARRAEQGTVAKRGEEIALVRMGDAESRELLAARQREEELAEQAAVAARIAASPLSRLRWKHRQEPANVPNPAAAKPSQPDTPPVIALATVPIFVLSRSLAPASAGVLV